MNIDTLIDDEQSKIVPYRNTLEANTIKELHDMVGATPSMKLDKRLGKSKLIDYMMEFFKENGYPTNPEYKADPTIGLHKIAKELEKDTRPYLTTPDFKKLEQEEYERNVALKREQQKARMELDEKWTPEKLDKLAEALGPRKSYDEWFPSHLLACCMTLINIFDDGNDVIIQAKLGDQITRMFERMKDNVEEEGHKQKAERRVLERRSLNLEIDRNQIEQVDSKIQRLKEQWVILNNAFVICKDQLRPRVLGQTGIEFGEYTTMAEMRKRNKAKKVNQKLNLDTLINDREHFDHYAHVRHEDLNLVEIPEDK
ncbi:MAG: hypothetical protein CBC24_09135 [Candidatus Pelagibacter sp. TMED64]|nr:MAG: hypothetical protein CBC24_09135 [Candidatus Pelagibacter sp. TMED64]|tara:strand:+ start:720 stop:1658 length:939 start_codon:yes stop_codon:yes gene_type:complete